MVKGQMFLCIDTATAYSGIALIDEGKCFYELLAFKQASEKIIETIDRVFEKAKKTPSNLKGVVVVKGPGSFTGLRVGISVANTFAHQLNIPIVGVTTDYFYQHATNEKDFFYLQSMNRDEVYVAGFGDYENKPEIIELTSFLSNYSNFKYIGELREAHQSLLINEERLNDQKKIEAVWKELVKNLEFSQNLRYQLVEAFYGKEPNITPAKK